MFHVLRFAVLAAALGCASAGKAGEWTGDVNLVLGFKTLDNRHWEPIQKNGETGFTFDVRKKNWPFSVAADAIWSRGRRFFDTGETGYIMPRGQGGGYIPPGIQGEVGVDTFEANAGVRKTWERFDLFRPFVGGGPAWVRADAVLDTPRMRNRHHGAGFGAWAAVGCYLVVEPGFNIGLDIRHTRIRIDMQDARNVDVGGQHYRLLLGCRW